MSLPLPAPAEQTQRAEAGGEEWESGGERRWDRLAGDALVRTEAESNTELNGLEASAKILRNCMVHMLEPPSENSICCGLRSEDETTSGVVNVPGTTGPLTVIDTAERSKVERSRVKVPEITSVSVLSAKFADTPTNS